MLESQGGVCAICRLPETKLDYRTKKIQELAVDHCHTTNKPRGLLCNSCNRGIGWLGDDADRVTAAAEYLRRY